MFILFKCSPPGLPPDTQTGEISFELHSSYHFCHALLYKFILFAFRGKVRLSIIMYYRTITGIMLPTANHIHNHVVTKVDFHFTSVIRSYNEFNSASMMRWYGTMVLFTKKKKRISKKKQKTISTVTVIQLKQTYCEQRLKTLHLASSTVL